MMDNDSQRPQHRQVSSTKPWLLVVMVDGSHSMGADWGGTKRPMSGIVEQAVNQLLYDMALQKGWALPEKWHDFSQHSYEQLPLPTDHLTAGQVLSFRDNAWQEYFTNSNYLDRIRAKFGQDVLGHINKLTSHKLNRKYAA